MEMDLDTGIYFRTNMTADKAIATAKQQVWVQGDSDNDDIRVRYLWFILPSAPGGNVEGLLRVATDTFRGKTITQAFDQRDFYRLFLGLFLMGGTKFLNRNLPDERRNNHGWEATIRGLAASRERITP